MAKLEELLKAQGFTDAEIEANKALLNDPKVRGALETSYQKLESDLTSYQTENQNWKDWHETHGKPTLALYEKDRADALAESAGLKERLRLAEEAGFAPTSSHKEPEKKPDMATPEAFDYKKYKLVTQDDVAKFADLEGQAIAMASDLNEEYRRLTGGKSLIEYEAEFDGRKLHGLQALRTEAIKANRRLDEYVSTKFDFAGKRQAIADKQRADAEVAIRLDEKSRLMKEFGDPNLRPQMPSRDPFIPRPASAEAKQPWDDDRTSSQRRINRLERAMETQMKGAVN